MNCSVLDGLTYKKMLRYGCENLRQNRKIVNDLNVFPIPDGDTGDNMYMTASSGVDGISQNDEHLFEVSKRVAKGMLLGARGNSGVILSRIFQGISDGLSGLEEATIADVISAFEMGVKIAYSSVSTPVEGTILTVLRESVEYVANKLSEYEDINVLFKDLLLETRRSLEDTPNKLLVLKEAGVVDSGGAGYYYIIEGMKKALDGEEINLQNEEKEEAKSVDTNDRLDENDEEAFGYCTEFLLQLMDKKDKKDFTLEGLNDYLKSVGGESIVSFTDGEIVKVHVHTKNPGAIIDYCQRYGEYLKLKIENMTLQNKSVKIQNNFSSPKLTVEHKNKMALLTVAMGEGIKNMFLEGGADYVIDGGQSMNPSVADILDAIKKVSAEKVIILPNNKNIKMSALQAKDLAEDTEVFVLPSASVGDGYTAMMYFDKNTNDFDSMLSEMQEAIKSSVSGEISMANRTTEMNGIKINEGDYIGFSGDDVFCDDKSIVDCTVSLCEKLSANCKDVLILLKGKNAKEEDSNIIETKISEKYKNLEVISIDGGQNVFDYILILE